MAYKKIIWPMLPDGFFNLASSNVHYYCRPDGLDVIQGGRDGLANTAERAFRQPQFAIDELVKNYNLGSQNGFVHLADGNYDGFRIPNFTAGRGVLEVSGQSRLGTVITGTPSTGSLAAMEYQSNGQATVRSMTIYKTFDVG